jgi:hypothetical protein
MRVVDGQLLSNLAREMIRCACSGVRITHRPALARNQHYYSTVHPLFPQAHLSNAVRYRSPYASNRVQGKLMPRTRTPLTFAFYTFHALSGFLLAIFWPLVRRHHGKGVQVINHNPRFSGHFGQSGDW